MTRGFEFWSSRRASGFILGYALLFALVYVSSLGYAVKHRMPSFFVVSTFLPYVALVAFRCFSRPYHGLLEYIHKETPAEYRTYGAGDLLPENRKDRNAIFAKAMQRLMNNETVIPDARLNEYRKNILRLFNVGNLTLVLWFFSSILVLPLLRGK